MTGKKTIKLKQLAQYRLTKLLVGLERQSLLAYKHIVGKIVDELVGELKAERLAKSDEIERGWTGEVARIEIDVDALLAPRLNKYFEALRWVMLGDAAGKEAKEAAKKVGISKMVTPGLIQSSYLASIDAQRDHYQELTGDIPSDIPAKMLKESLEEIFDRSNRFIQQLTDQLKHSLLSAVEQASQQQNMRNLTAAHQAVHEAGVVEDAIRGLSAKDLRDDLETVTEQFENKWDLMGRSSIGQSAAVGTHQAMVEVVGRTQSKIRVANIEMQDEKVCTFCHNISKNPDGSWIFYDPSELEPAGYNFTKKRAGWKISFAPLHHRCRCATVWIPEGFKLTKIGTLTRA